MRKYCELKANGLEPKYIFEPSVGLTFDSEAEAVDFYNLHSWEVGFGTKKGSWVLNNDGYQTNETLNVSISLSLMGYG
ncbi:unnamed protein product [Urochloa humidicola]